MREDFAIIAGRGELPKIISDEWPEALVVSFKDVGIDYSPRNHFVAEFEKAGAFFRKLKRASIKRVCFAGKITRPQLKWYKMDMRTAFMLPKLNKAIHSTDGSALTIVRKLMESEDLEVIGAHEIIPSLLAGNGVLTQASPKEPVGLSSAIKLHDALSLGDVGQSIVMNGDLCLAVETLPGTEAMLKFVEEHRDTQIGGFILKASKKDQDLTIDMATIGPNTVDQVVRAGLEGIYLGASNTQILNRAEVINRANKAGIFIQGIEW